MIDGAKEERISGLLQDRSPDKGARNADHMSSGGERG